jgi:hypothetical protein
VCSSDLVTEGTNLYYTEARVNANANVAANTAARHAAVTIGTANGLSLSTQALSLAAASTSTTGALTSTDWNTFNGKQAALNGTGFVKISGTTISYDNSTYLTTSAASSTYLPLAGGTLTGALSGTSATFSGNLNQNAPIFIDNSNHELASFSNNNLQLFFGSFYDGTNVIAKSGAGGRIVMNGGAFSFQTFGSATIGNAVTPIERFAISNGGAASFTSSVTAGGSSLFNANNGTLSADILTIKGGGGTGAFGFRVEANNGEAIFRTNNLSYNVLMCENGGAVGIGTSSPSSLLQLAGGGTGTRGALRFSDAGLSNYWEIGRDNGSTGNFTFSSQASQFMTITTGGNVGIGTSSPSRKLQVYGTASVFEGILVENSTSNAYALYQSKTGNSSLWQFGTWNDNSFRIGTSGVGDFLTILSNGIVLIPSVYSQTSGAAANVIVGSDGNLFRSTSSLKYKKNVENYNKGLAEVMQLRAVTYNGINEIDGDKQFAGLIAEEVHDLGLTEFVQYAEDGTPDALAYQNMIALAFKAIQELKLEIEQLKNK